MVRKCINKKRIAVTIILTMALMYFYGVAPCSLTYADDSLVVAHITDPHIGNNVKYNQRFSSILWMAEKEADIIFLTGDLTNGPKKSEAMMQDFLDRIKDIKVPIILLRGNHDDPAVFTGMIGAVDSVNDIGNYRIIGIDTLNINFDWLEQWMVNDKIMIILGHYPLKTIKGINASRLQELFLRFNVIAYFSGHTTHTVARSEETVLITSPHSKTGQFAIVNIQGRTVESIRNILFEMSEVAIP